jgi:hypothetical protein
VIAIEDAGKVYRAISSQGGVAGEDQGRRTGHDAGAEQAEWEQKKMVFGVE